jgi:large subunit ribosomal protein L5
MNRMKAIRLEKLTLNIGAGEAGSALEKAKALIEKISGKKIVVTRTSKRTTFGTPKGRPIGVKVTLRDPDATQLLKKLLHAVDNQLSPSCFDAHGNFSFGIHEYINIPGIKYDPDIGILGMDVAVTLERPGFRVTRRMYRPAKVGSSHLITHNDAQEFVQKAFGVTLKSGEE